jgi:hypothetical protein
VWGSFCDVNLAWGCKPRNNFIDNIFNLLNLNREPKKIRSLRTVNDKKLRVKISSAQRKSRDAENAEKKIYKKISALSAPPLFLCADEILSV